MVKLNEVHNSDTGIFVIALTFLSLCLLCCLKCYVHHTYARRNIAMELVERKAFSDWLKV